MKKTSIVVLVLIALFVLSSSAVFVDETEHIIITQFGQHRRTVSDPGLTFKLPFVQKVTRIEKRILDSDAPPEEYLTADKKRLMADPITRWRVSTPLEFYKTVRDETTAQRRLDDVVLSELRQELAQHTMSEMVGSSRVKMMANVTKRAHAKAAKFGIDVVDVRIKHLDLPREVQRSVFDRMVAERERLAKGYRAQGQEESDKITSQTDKEQQIILAQASKEAERLRGEGDGLSTKIYAAAYSEDPEFYAFIRTLEAYDNSFDAGSTLVLSTKSPLFRYLTKPGEPVGNGTR